MDGTYVRLGWQLCLDCEWPVKDGQATVPDKKGNKSHGNCFLKRKDREEKAKAKTPQPTTTPEGTT